MADEQPGDDAPAAVPPDPIRVPGHTAEASTAAAPVRWSGAAAVPPAGPRKSWWSRRPPALPPEEPAERNEPNESAEPDDWAVTPPVDPWEGQDTPWDPMPLPPEVMPPTRVEPPAVPAPPQVDPRAAATSAPPASAKPPVASPPRKRRWGRRSKPPQPVSRVPVSARPPVLPYPPPHQRRATPARPVALGPGSAGHPWAPPRPGPFPPPRGFPPPRPRRRRWPRNLAVFTLLTVICCCGVPALLVLPAGGQHPVTAVLPDAVSDLNLRDDAASKRAARRLSDELGSADAFAGIYSDGNGKRVTIFGTTGLRFTPEQDVEAQIRHLTADYDIRDVQRYDLGEPGLHERCGVGRAAGASVVVCVWADHGSLATVLLTRRSITDSAELTGVLRNAVLVKR